MTNATTNDTHETQAAHAPHETAQASAAPAGLSPRVLAALVGVGASTALWALFQWAELLVARGGGHTFCSVNSTFNCAAVWDSSFAAAVHAYSGLPLAGWGLVWGVMAAVAPLLALERRASGGSAKVGSSAALVAGGAGMLAVVALAVVSATLGEWCLACMGTYVLVFVYAGLAFGLWRPGGGVDWSRGVGLAAVTALAVYAVLLWPGLRTPESADAEMAVPKATTASSRKVAPSPQTLLVHYLAQLSPQAKQVVSDSLQVMRQSPIVPMPKPRALVGSASAPMRLTEFTDTLCSHCAHLHETLVQLRKYLPPSQLAIESRQFPLDSGCNAVLKGPPQHPVRCLAAKAQICMEGNAGAFDYAGALFAHQNTLTGAQVYSLAKPYTSEAKLKACVAAAATAKKLAADVQWAGAFNIDGTPLVLVNGKRATPIGPFLYALALAKGNINDPAFASLPKPDGMLNGM